MTLLQLVYQGWHNFKKLSATLPNAYYCMCINDASHHKHSGYISQYCLPQPNSFFFGGGGGGEGGGHILDIFAVEIHVIAPTI